MTESCVGLSGEVHWAGALMARMYSSGAPQSRKCRLDAACSWCISWAAQPVHRSSLLEEAACLIIMCWF